MSSAADEVHSPKVQRRVGAACLIGNFLEYYDFAVYGFFAAALGAWFFPSGSDAVALLQSLAVFGVAFAFRPLGGVVFGILSDRAGRRVSLSVSIVAMSLATSLIGVLPSYAAVGVLAPTVLVVLRCVQGVSVGGEWGASSAFLMETARPGRRGMRGSYPSMGAALGLIAGGLLALLLGGALNEEAFNSWGWRVPFFVAAPLGLLGLYIRWRLEDTPVFQHVQASTDRPRAKVRDAVRRDRLHALGVTFTFSWICGVGLYYFGAYVVNYLSATAGLSGSAATLYTASGLMIYVLLLPLAGRLSDRFGRRRTLLFGCAGHAVLGVPMFLLLGSGQGVLVMVALTLYAIIQAPINANTSLCLIELFPASTRLTSGALGFNLGVGPPSGFGPLVAAALVSATGLSVAPAFFLVAVAAVCGLVLLRYLPETAGRDLYSEHVAARERGPVAVPQRVAQH